MAEPTDPGRGDWTGRIPGLGRLSERGRQLVLLIGCLILIAVLGVVIYLTPATSSGSTRNTPPPATNASQPAGTNPTMPGSQTSGSAVDPVEPTGPASDDAEESGSPAAPEPTGSSEPHDHDHPGTYGPDPTPVYSPTSTRSADKADQAEGQAVLAEVVPAWAEADFGDVRPDEAENPSNPTAAKRRAWVASWREEGLVTNSFVKVSSKRFIPLWSGAMQMQAKVTEAKVIESKLLWNSGADSLWRVTVQRSVSAPGVTSEEEVTWDFQIAQEGSSYQLVSFADPDPANEDPETYRPANP